MRRRTLLHAAAAIPAAAAAVRLAPDLPVHLTNVQKVLWVFAHPDDEVIAAGLSMRQHLEAGLDCHLLLATQGTASGVLAQLNGTGINPTWGMPHNPTAEGYATLTAAQFGTARIAESTDAMRVLASGTGATVTLWEAGLSDGSVTKADVMTAIQAVYGQICASGEAVWLKSHTDALNPDGSPVEHPDHTACAQAVRQLSVDDPAVFGNVRFYPEPDSWTNTAVIARSPHRILPVSGTDQAAATRNACRAFSAWAPASGRFAIGEQSVPSLFLASPENRYHT